MLGRCDQTLHKRHTNGQHACDKIVNVTGYWEGARAHHGDVPTRQRGSRWRDPHDQVLVGTGRRGRGPHLADEEQGCGSHRGGQQDGSVSCETGHVLRIQNPASVQLPRKRASAPRAAPGCSQMPVSLGPKLETSQRPRSPLSG